MSIVDVLFYLTMSILGPAGIGLYLLMKGADIGFAFGIYATLASAIFGWALWLHTREQE